jgi:hypothetical protein
VRGGVAWAYHLGGGEKREAWWKEREGKREGMGFWRCCVMSEESDVDESLALGGGKFGEWCVRFKFWKVRRDEKEYRHEDGDRREGSGKFGEGAVKFENSKDGQVNGTENFRFLHWAASVFRDGYVDRWESAESWVGEGEEMMVMMGAGRSWKAKLVQTRQNKKGEACKCQGGGSGGGMERVPYWWSYLSFYLDGLLRKS